MTINAVICDDDKSCSELVLKYLLKYCEERQIDCFYECYNNTEDVVNSTTKYNIAFLDVEIDNVSGLEIAKSLKERNENVIVFFITQYEKYIDDAMDLFALRYIKKPLDYSRFYKGLDKAIELINQDVIDVYLKDSTQILKLNACDIMYVEIIDHKTKIVTEKEIYYSKSLLDYWQKKLTHSSFYRIHKSYIINLDYVVKYQRNEVTMRNGNIIGISYRNQATFRKYFTDYLNKRK